MPDERLARWAARGSEAAFAVIFERHHQALHRYCHSIVGNGHDASDALQSTMLKAFRALSGETREINLRPWLYRIAHNESISLLRARRPDADLDAAAHVGDPRTEGVIESRDRLRALAGDLTELTEQQRGALLMRELGGLEFAEIAVALDVSPAAAKQSVYESRCVLQALQEGREMDCDVVRRTLSDGDRRALRGKRLRGHLRSCAGCQAFEHALRERPAHLAALAPPLPLAAGAAMLSGLLGGGGFGGGGFGAGGGLIASLTGAAKGVAGVSMATKVATVAIVGTTAVGGGALVVVPDRGANAQPAPPARSAAATPAAGADATAPRLSPAHATTSAGEAALGRGTGPHSERGPAERAGAAGGHGASQGAPGQNKAAGVSAAGRGRPAGAPGTRRAKPAAAGRGRSGRAVGKPAAGASTAGVMAAARARAKARAAARAEAKARALAQRKRPAAPVAGDKPGAASSGAGRTAGAGAASRAPR